MRYPFVVQPPMNLQFPPTLEAIVDFGLAKLNPVGSKPADVCFNLYKVLTHEGSSVKARASNGRRPGKYGSIMDTPENHDYRQSFKEKIRYNHSLNYSGGN